MAIAIDGSSPAAVTWTGTWTSAKTTSSFTPPAGLYIIALLSADGTANAACTGSVSDSLTGSWSLLKRQNYVQGGFGGTAEVWFRTTVTTNTSMTVSATCTANGSTGGLLVAQVLTGCKSTQAGVTGGTQHLPGVLTIAITPGAAGNLVFGAGYDYDASTAFTANGSTTSLSVFQDSTNGDTWGTFKGSSTTVTSSTTFGWSTPASCNNNICAVEIQAAAGAAFIAEPNPMVVNPAQVRSYNW